MNTAPTLLYSLFICFLFLKSLFMMQIGLMPNHSYFSILFPEWQPFPTPRVRGRGGAITGLDVVGGSWGSTRSVWPEQPTEFGESTWYAKLHE